MGLLPMGANILPPSDDRVFKLILTSEESKPILIDFLSAVLDVHVVDVTIRNCELPSETQQEKGERLDINVLVDEGGRLFQVDIEMHVSRIQEDPGGKFENFKGKIVYYLCDFHASQSAKGVKRYDRLLRTYQITLCSYTVFPERTSFVNSFALRHNEDNGLLTDAIQVVIVELSKLEEIMRKSVRDMTDLEKWAVFFRYADEPEHRETVNRVIASKEALQMAGERLMSISQDEREQALSRSRRMAETDRLSDLTTAWDNGKSEGLQEGFHRGHREGRQEGRQEGIQEGLQKGLQQGRHEGKHEGILEGKRDMAQRMAAAGEPEDRIMRYTGLSAAEIKNLTCTLRTADGGETWDAADN